MFRLSCSMLLVASTSALDAQEPRTLRYSAYALDVPSGKDSVQLGRLTVLENRSQPAGRRIEIAFVRLPSTAARPAAPIVYLAGGPGGSGIGTARVPEFFRLFQALRGVADVILLSQRGTGLSNPRLTCPPEEPIADDVFASLDAMTRALLPRTRRCAERWRGQGVDLSAYSTEASADDLEDLRLALGVPRLTLFGFSYGTHLALSALRRHPDSFERAVLLGVEGPDESLKFPHTYDQQLRKLAALERETVAAREPDLEEVLRDALARLRRTPSKVQIDDARGKREIQIGPDGLLYLLRIDIGDTNDSKMLARLIREVARGESGTLQRLAQRRFTGLAGGGNLMAYAMDCASGANPSRLAQIVAEMPASTFGRLTNYPFPEVCDALQLNALGHGFRAPVFSQVPTLFVSGTLDSNTPPHQAERVRWGFPHSVHVVVENAGHETSMSLNEVNTLIVDFLRGVDVRVRQFSVPSPFR